MSDQLRERLNRIDPMRTDAVTEQTIKESSRHLLEKIMSTSTEERVQPSPSSRRRAWVPALAAGALVLAVAGGVVLNNDPAAPPLVLSATGDNPAASCIAFSPEELERVAELAFAGTVTAVNGAEVRLSVQHWFRGGEATEVVLNAPPGMEALIGGIPFTVGDEYLVTADSGNVNYCGFSGPASPEYRAAFDEAFAQG